MRVLHSATPGRIGSFPSASGGGIDRQQGRTDDMIPTQMRAILVNELGATPGLRDAPVPGPGPGEVLIRVAACGLNFRRPADDPREYQEKPALPFSPGMEIAGRVAALGAGVAAARRGDPGGGGLRSSADCAVRRSRRRRGLRPLPDAMPMSRRPGSRSPMAPRTWRLTRRARLQAGETLLVHGRGRRGRADRGRGRQGAGRAGRRGGARRRQAGGGTGGRAPTI